jgi:hypothetical protein
VQQQRGQARVQQVAVFVAADCEGFADHGLFLGPVGELQAGRSPQNLHLLIPKLKQIASPKCDPANPQEAADRTAPILNPRAAPLINAQHRMLPRDIALADDHLAVLAPAQPDNRAGWEAEYLGWVRFVEESQEEAVEEVAAFWQRLVVEAWLPLRQQGGVVRQAQSRGRLLDCLRQEY